MFVRIGKSGSRNFLQIGNELIEITDYNIKSSADGSTELSVVIKGISNEVEMSANLEEPMQ